MFFQGKIGLFLMLICLAIGWGIYQKKIPLTSPLVASNNNTKVKVEKVSAENFNEDPLKDPDEAETQTGPITSAPNAVSNFEVDLNNKDVLQEFLTLNEDDHILGVKDAPITIIEYSSLACPHCKTFYEEILPELKTKYIDTHKLRFVSREYALNLASLKGAMVLHCLPQEKYFDVRNLLFKKQTEWAYATLVEQKLEAVAVAAGMSREEFNACLENKEIENKILTMRQDADKKLNVAGTPVYIINGKLYNGLHSKQFFFDTLDKLLAEMAAAQTTHN